MAAPKAPLLDAAGKTSKDVTLEETIFGAEVKPHLVHETVRAELNEQRKATRGTKTRALVSGGRSKPWRQKGTGRARAGTTRAPHWTGGGVAFPTGERNFEVKVNRKARHAALRGALSSHAVNGTLACSTARASTRRPRSVLPICSRRGGRSLRSSSWPPTRSRT
jgi:large subunit ribosomal protein L4